MSQQPNSFTLLDLLIQVDSVDTVNEILSLYAKTENQSEANTDISIVVPVLLNKLKVLNVEYDKLKNEVKVTSEICKAMNEKVGKLNKNITEIYDIVNSTDLDDDIKKLATEKKKSIENVYESLKIEILELKKLELDFNLFYGESYQNIYERLLFLYNNVDKSFDKDVKTKLINIHTNLLESLKKIDWNKRRTAITNVLPQLLILNKNKSFDNKVQPDVSTDDFFDYINQKNDDKKLISDDLLEKVKILRNTIIDLLILLNKVIFLIYKTDSNQKKLCEAISCYNNILIELLLK